MNWPLLLPEIGNSSPGVGEYLNCDFGRHSRTRQTSAAAAIASRAFISGPRPGTMSPEVVRVTRLLPLACGEGIRPAWRRPGGPWPGLGVTPVWSVTKVTTDTSCRRAEIPHRHAGSPGPHRRFVAVALAYRHPNSDVRSDAGRSTSCGSELSAQLAFESSPAICQVAPGGVFLLVNLLNDAQREHQTHLIVVRPEATG